MNKFAFSILTCILLIPSDLVLSLPIDNLQYPSIIANTSSNNDIRSLAQSITVKILVGNTAATGFILAKDGNAYTVVTNAHIVNLSGAYQIKAPDGNIYPAILTYKDDANTGNDLALLQFSSTQSYSVAELGNSANLSENEEVYSAGYPYDSNELVFNHSTISLITDKPIKGGYQIGFTNETQQGMSGSPLFNSEGKVIGILGLGSDAILQEAYIYSDGTRPDGETLERIKKASFAVPVAQLNTVIASNKDTVPTTPTYTGFIADINKIAQEITVRIDYSANGSGVIVAKNGQTYYVLTAAHVVNNPQETYEVVTHDGEKHPVNYQTVTVLEGVDMAVLEFTSSKPYTVARLGNYNLGLKYLDDLEGLGAGWIFVSGFPGFTATTTTKAKHYLSSGRIWSKETANFASKDQYSLYGGQDLIYTAMSYGGMSGGAVLDSKGRVIGINTGAENEYTTDSQEINVGQSLGVPITTFIGVASSAKIQSNWLTIESDKPSDLTNNEVEQIRNQLFTLQTPKNEASASNWLNYCNGLWRSFQYNEAIKACDIAIEKQPDLANAYYLKGLSFSYQLKNQEALLPFEQATKVSPSFHQAWRWQGFNLSQLERYSEALTAYEQAIKLAPGEFTYYVEQGIILYYLKNYPQAIEAYNRALNIKQHPWVYYNRGILYSDLQEYEKALSDYGKSIEINPQDAQAYNNRGVLYSDLKEYEKALSDLGKAIEINPQDADAYYNKGNLYTELKEYEKALLNLSKAIELNPQYAKAYNNRGYVYEDLQEYEKALIDLNKAIELNPQYADAYNNRGNVYLDLREYEKALFDYGKTIEINPQYAQAYNNRGILYTELKEYEKALFDLNKAIEINPQYANAYFNRGNLYYHQLKEYEKALSDYSKVIEINSQNTLAYYNRGNLYYQLKEYEKALFDYGKAIEINPQYAEAYASRGLIYYETGNKQQSISDLQTASELFRQQGNMELYQQIMGILQQL